MATDTVEALCGKCKVPLDGPADGNDHDTLTCPSCGRSAKRKSVKRDVTKHVAELTERHVQESIRSATRGSKLFKFAGKPIPKRSYRFISNLKL